MASFLKRGKTWRYKISAKPKDITKSGFKTKKEAQIAAAEMESKLNQGILPHLKPKQFDEYFENWIEVYKKNVSELTKLHYQDSLTAVREYFGSRHIQGITKSDYQKFINDFGAKRAKETVTKLNRHVRACVRDAVDERIIPFDFTRNVTITYTVKAKSPEDKHLNYIDSQKLQREVYNRLDKGLVHYLILLAINSGMRYSEMVGLTRNDFDFKNNTITINKTWYYKPNVSPGFGPTKNFENRTIKMNKKVMTLFNELFDTLPSNIHKLVFYSPKSKNKVISNRYANDVLRGMLDDLKINRITMHGLRHTHASVLIYKKISINYVSERLGHKDINTTLGIYTHILKEMRQEDEENTIKLLDNMVG
ncbi:tyrosine-type recombinase/integrase [Gracilibacillus marinus]|uniref:Tyrosine-type recombinase/integrase n=1 Tax=Gracilibacillus marinus TaxID=630535 RepID=A0ABV8VX72_9BACI